MIRTASALIFLGFLASAAPLSSQQIPTRTLLQPEARFEEGFTRVAGIRELRDGRVIIVDSRDLTVQLLDAAWKRLTPIGRPGAGPGEYREPSRPLAFIGDSTIVVDDLNRRLLVITPDGKPTGTILSSMFAARDSRAPAAPRVISRADGLGNFYATGQQVAVARDGTQRLADSVVIERWHGVSNKRDTVAFIPVPLRPGSRLNPSGYVSFSMGEAVPFETRPQYAVARDGRIAILYVEPFHVDIVEVNGQRRYGQPMRYEPIRVSDGHKQQYMANLPRPATPQAPPPGMSATRGTGAGRPDAGSPKWPEYLPPFLPGALNFTNEGMLWLQRTTPANEPDRFDVMDRDGRVVEQIRLPRGSRVVGFGNGAVYVVRRDDLDVEYLERYRFSATGNR